MNNSIYKIAVCDDSQADIDYLTILVFLITILRLSKKLLMKNTFQLIGHV